LSWLRFRCRCVVAVRLMCVVLSCSRCCFVLLSVLPSGRLTVCLLGPLVARCSGHHHACRGGGDVSGTRKDFASAACVVFVAGRCRALCAGGMMRWNWALCAGSSVPVQSMRWSPVSRKMGVVAKATTVHTEGKCTFQQRTQRDYTRAPHASSGRTFQWHCLTCPGDSPRFFKRDIARAALQLQVEILFCRCLSPLCRVVFRFLFLFLCLLLGLSVLCPPFAVAGLVAGRQQAFPSLHCSHFSPSLFCRKQRKSGLVRQGRRSLE